MRFSLFFFFRMMQHRAGDGRFRQAGNRGWWCNLAAASYALPGSDQRWPPFLSTWPSAAEDRAQYGAAGDEGGDGTAWGMVSTVRQSGLQRGTWQSGVGGHAVRCGVERGVRSSAGWKRMRRYHAGEGHGEEPRAGEGSSIVFF
jgi:hypothetical protein